MEDMEDMDIGEERRDPLTLNPSQLLMLMLNLGTLPMDMVLDTLMVDMADGGDMVDTVDMEDTVVDTTMESNSITYQKLRLQDLSLTTLLLHFPVLAEPPSSGALLLQKVDSSVY